MQAPINSIKHFVPRPRVTTVTGTIFTHTIIDAVPQNNVVNVEDVVEGSVIKAVLVEFWMSPANSTVNTQFTFVIMKLPSGQPLPTVSNLLNLQAYDNKKNILYTTQGVMGIESGQGSLPLHRSWINIPKGKQRFGLGDRFIWAFVSVEEKANICSMNIYKEYK